MHFLKERNVNFYADRLNITHGYLSSTVKSVSGKTPLDWLQEYVLEHKDTKKRRSYSDTKTTSDLKVATKACSGKTLWTL